MTISPMNFNGMLQRTEDVSQVKHQEDAKPVTDQQNIQSTVEQHQDSVLHQVNNPDDSAGADTEADARKEGRGTYFDNRKKTKKSDEPKEDRVIRKTPGPSFDIKI